MVARFGSGSGGADGELDRQAVAELVFNDGQALADLNAIVHPAVGLEIARRLEAAAGRDNVVVLDVPLLVESGRSDMAALSSEERRVGKGCCSQGRYRLYAVKSQKKKTKT